MWAARVAKLDRLLPRLLIGFAVWSVVGWYLFPAYQRFLVPATETLLHWIQPHNLAIQLEHDYPWVKWRFVSADFGHQGGRISFLLLVYNTVLYFTLLIVVKGLSTRQRVWLGLSAVPFIFGFHLFDLALTLESRALSIVQQEHYDFVGNFGFWFSLVKVYNFMSIMAVKQVTLIGLFALQFHVARRIRGEETA